MSVTAEHVRNVFQRYCELVSRGDFEAIALLYAEDATVEDADVDLRGADEPLHEDRSVVFEGGFCEQPPFELIRAIGRSCYVVDDDLLIGLRWILADLPVTGDPLDALAWGYLERSSYSPVQHDPRKQKEDMLLQRVRESNASAVILAAAKMCEPGLEEQVAYVHALDEAKLPYFVTEFEENMTSYDTLEIQLETFVENLLFV